MTFFAAAQKKPPKAILSYMSKGQQKNVRINPALTISALCLCFVMFLSLLGAGAYIFLNDDLAGASMKRQARMQTLYEDRISALRAQVDLVTSRQLLDQQAVEMKVAKLLRKQQVLGERQSQVRAALGISGQTVNEKAPIKLGSLLGSRSSAPEYSDPNLLSALEQSLAETEKAQVAELEIMRAAAEQKSRKIAKILKKQGVSLPQEIAIGGPLIKLKGGSEFTNFAEALETSLSTLEKVRLAANRLPHGNPVPGKKTSSLFGSRRDPFTGSTAMHGGLDFRAERGTPVLATASGKVVKAGRNGGYGKMVEIDHGDGITTRYAHLSRISVSVGAKIKRGVRIGKVGSTGRSTGPHLHYEVRRKGRVMNPIHYVRLAKHLRPYF